MWRSALLRHVRRRRNLTRYRVQLMGDRTRHAGRLEKLLEDASIKLSSVASNITGTSSREMLAALVRAGRFREDLYYRLNVLPLRVPPLRERRADIPALVEVLGEDLALRSGMPQPELAAEALALLKAQHWRGNIRELRNVIEQASLMCARDQIDVADLNLRDVPGLVSSAAASTEVKESKLADTERAMIIGALRETSGNVTLAARALFNLDEFITKN